MNSRLSPHACRLGRSRRNGACGRSGVWSGPQMSDVNAIKSGRDIFVTAQDGLRLHVREHGSRASTVLPVVCLPGLARTVADFEELATLLSNGPLSRRVIAIDA